MSGMPGEIALLFVVLFVAHQVADHWVQTSHQSMHKGLRGWVGSWACLKHVATYTATTTFFVGSVTSLLHLTWQGFLLGQLLSAVTHYWADRRFTLAWLAKVLGKGEFYRLGSPRPDHDDNPSIGTGAYALDQSFHYLWLLIAAVTSVTL